MALFYSTCKFPILCPFPRYHALQMPFSYKNSISKTFYFGISRISVCAQRNIIKPFVRKAEYRSSLDSPGDLEEGSSSSVIVFIKGLGQSTTDGVLKEAFSQFGDVNRVKIISDKKTKQSLGFAYVWFTKEEHARAAVDVMNGQFLEGRFIRVEIAKPGSCKPRPKSRPYKF